jgi:hypothetical protein
MTKKPPIPPKERAPMAGSHDRDVKKQVPDRVPPENLEQQDEEGNIHQNTRNQGYQQER